MRHRSGIGWGLAVIIAFIFLGVGGLSLAVAQAATPPADPPPPPAAKPGPRQSNIPPRLRRRLITGANRRSFVLSWGIQIRTAPTIPPDDRPDSLDRRTDRPSA